MAFDGAFLCAVKHEIESVAADARVDKIYQPSREEVVLGLRWRGGSAKLLICVGANSPRVHFTSIPIENPKSPPMFCMLLRKHLGAGRLICVEQIGMDRILNLHFEAVNELGDLVRLKLVIEIMGRHSNLILVSQEGRVIDSIKRIDDEMSSVRRVLPGVQYELPPIQNKLNPMATSAEELVDAVKAARNNELSKAILSVIQGVSPILCREMAYYAARGAEIYKDDADAEVWSRLKFYLETMQTRLANGDCVYTMAVEQSGKPKEFTFVPIHQYGTYMLTKTCASAGELLDSFYAERDRVERMKQRSHSVLKLLVNTSDRIARKLVAQRTELAECAEREQLKICGDLLNANLYSMQKGQESITVQNFYDESGADITIKLDPALTPAENAQRYYKEYRKAATAEDKLKDLITSAEQELVYIDSVFDAVSRTTGESELAEIREELVGQGYIKRMKGKKQAQQKTLKPLEYRSVDGFTILCGRNNIQNDRLTTKTARGNDIWCHTHNIPGSHVIVLSRGEQVPDSTIEQACYIAAYNSKARNSSQVPVDYTEVRHVKKPNGAKPGMVIFENNKTVFINPDETLVKSLAIDGN